MTLTVYYPPQSEQKACPVRRLLGMSALITILLLLLAQPTLAAYGCKTEFWSQPTWHS
jgi:hypothetical protein